MPLRSRVLQLVETAVPLSLSVLVIVALSAWSLSDPGPSGKALASTPATPTASAASGYWLVGTDGGVFNFGDAQFHGSAGSLHLNAPIVGMATTPDGSGYWLVASDGGVFTYGDAVFHGSTGGLHLNAPIVGMATTPDGGGYWLVASDGGIFTYGDAVFHGSTGGLHLNKPVVGMAAAPGGGYWLVASDGGVFTYGDAVFHGSTGGLHLNAPIVGVAATPDGGGYWLVASDGGIFTNGDAVFHGSTGGLHLNKPVVGMAAAPGGGYWLVASDGGIFSYGDAVFHGSTGGLHLNAPVVAAASEPGGSGGGGTTTQPSGGPCVTGDNSGLPASGGAFDDPADINNSNGYNTYVAANVFSDFDLHNNIKLCGNSASNWNMTWNAADAGDAGGGAVQGYPDIQQLYTDWGPNTSAGPTPISALTSLTSTFNTTNPSDSIGQWEMAYDLWFNNYGSDIMIWENTSTARGIISNYGGANILNPNVSIDGNSYTLIDYCGQDTCPLSQDPELMLVRNTNVNAGTENILDDLHWLQSNGYLGAGDALGQVDFGWEICDSDSQNLTMAVDGYTLTRTPENAG